MCTFVNSHRTFFGLCLCLFGREGILVNDSSVCGSLLSPGLKNRTRTNFTFRGLKDFNDVEPFTKTWVEHVREGD